MGRLLSRCLGRLEGRQRKEGAMWMGNEMGVKETHEQETLGWERLLQSSLEQCLDDKSMPSGQGLITMNIAQEKERVMRKWAEHSVGYVRLAPNQVRRI